MGKTKSDHPRKILSHTAWDIKVTVPEPDHRGRQEPIPRVQVRNKTRKPRRHRIRGRGTTHGIRQPRTGKKPTRLQKHQLAHNNCQTKRKRDARRSTNAAITRGDKQRDKHRLLHTQVVPQNSKHDVEMTVAHTNETMEKVRYHPAMGEHDPQEPL